MAHTVDARGLPCPQPVLRTREALREYPTDEIVTLVTGRDQAADVARLAEKGGRTAEIEPFDDGFAVRLAPPATPERTPVPAAAAPQPGGPTVVVISAAEMGRGDQELGGILVRTFLHTLTELEQRADMLLLYNAGVHLAVEGSPVLDDLRALEAGGCQILVCGTCPKHYGLRERLAVGSVSNMYAIAEAMLGAGHLLTV